MDARNLGLKALQSQIGRVYQYGGDATSIGVDCSGLAQIVLMAMGFNLGGDYNAAGLRDFFKGCEIKRNEAQVGDLYFYGKPVNHVMICSNVWSAKYRILIGACSGTSKTTTLDVAWMQSAYVKCVKDDYWLNNLNCVINPFLKK